MSAVAVPRIRYRIPFAAVVAASIAAVVPANASASSCANANANPNAVSIRTVQKATLCLLNAERHRHGLRGLHENTRLDRASVRHSKDMARNDYFAHGDFVGRIRSVSYLSGARSWAVGENIAWGSGSYGTPASIVRMWMNSPPHRHNILSGGFREIGIGIARGTPDPRYSNGATYTTDFGARG